MKKSNKAIAAVAIGAAAIVALGACSSESDQAEGNREAAASEASPTAPASPTATVALPESLGKDFRGVTVTRGGSATCITKPHEDDLEVVCENVGANLLGDQVFIRVPDIHYRIHIKSTNPSNNATMRTTVRDSFYVGLKSLYDDDITWNQPYSKGTNDPWGVGIDGLHGYLNVVATVTKV